jgi:hypothetical protein
MSNQDNASPFHAGEIEAQSRAGVNDVAQWAKGFIRGYLPDQHRQFHTSLPFFIVAGADENEQTWITLIEGDVGFVQSPDPYQITLSTHFDNNEPLKNAFNKGSHIGVLGIELATRRRNRFSGYIHPEGNVYTIDIQQTFGNCPQYIHQRALQRVEQIITPASTKTSALNEIQIAQINAADTLFIGSGQMHSKDKLTQGYDASHRGGEPGFAKVVNSTHIQIPDYAGNNFFNTIGNLITDPRIGLLFINFATGDLLQITGKATIDWNPQHAHDANALRMVNVEIEMVLERPQAISLRWNKHANTTHHLKLIKREQETNDIVSFSFSAADNRPLPSFKAGQHLPIEIQLPGQSSVLRRSYSLSSSPQEQSHYRLSIKREQHGKVSNYLHNHLFEGGVLITQEPAGDFVTPCSQCPLVLVSAGIGLTPMLSILHDTAEQERTVWFIHSARNGKSHALGNEVTKLVTHGKHVKQKTFYSQPNENDIEGRDYDVKGRMTAADLIALNAGSDAHYMLCGPTQFLSEIQTGLETAGISPDKIHFETFGPTSK